MKLPRGKGRGAGLRIAVSAAMIAVLLAVVPLRALADAVRQASFGVWVMVVCAFMTCHLFAAMKWRFLTGREAGLPLVAAVQAHFAGLIGNLCLPGVVGGDLVRASVALRRAEHPAFVAVGSVVDRVVDTVALVVVAVTGLIMVGARNPALVRPVLIVAAVVCGAGVTGAVAVLVLLRHRGAARLIAKIREPLEVLTKHPGRVAIALTMSVAIQMTLATLNVVLGYAAGVDCGFGAWFVAWPMAKLVAFVPVSIAGFGVREAALIGLLKPFGGVPSAVMAAGLLWDAVLAASSIIGWTVVRFVPDERPSPQPEFQPS